MVVVQYIEKEFLGGKHLTRNTANTINALERAYGAKPLLFLLSKKESDWLREKEYNNQSHFESTILLLFKKNAPYIKKEYEMKMAELRYNSCEEPPSFFVDKNKESNKKKRKWVI